VVLGRFIMEFQVVDRPTGAGNIPSALIEELRKTATNGKALQLKLAPNTFVTWQANVRAQLRTQFNLRLRTKHNKATSVVTCWAEKFDAREIGEAISDTDLGVTDNGNGGEDDALVSKDNH
jgi:hypothetical protein